MEINPYFPQAGGGKLSRSETVSVRFDPRLRYLAELASRLQRRTLSSYIEWAVAESLKNVRVQTTHDGESVEAMGSALWDEREFVRLTRLRDLAPHLLSYQDDRLLKVASHVLAELGTPNDESQQFAAIEPYWEYVKASAAANLPLSDVELLIEQTRSRPVTAEDIDKQIDRLRQTKASLMSSKASSRGRRAE